MQDGSRLLVIWDFDSALGQVNSGNPYNFSREPLHEELENVQTLLRLFRERDLAMTFACLGFAAEAGPPPFHVPEVIRDLRRAGHEIASHSWRHEWLPHLEQHQLVRTLQRSKEALETCLEEPGAVRGFVPPFNRPMTWLRKGALSRGDRAASLLKVGGNLGSLLRQVRTQGYAWCRVRYRPLLGKLLEGGFGRQPPLRQPEVVGGLTCVPMHYCGFDEPALALLTRALTKKQTLVLGAHPGALSRNGAESKDNLLAFLDVATQLRERGDLRIQTVSDGVGLDTVSRNASP